MRLAKFKRKFATGCFLLSTLVVVPSCDQKEEVIDVETPKGEVEVERDKNTGKVNVEIRREKERVERDKERE